MAASSLALIGRNCEVCGKPMVFDSQSPRKALTSLVCPNGHLLFVDMHGREVK